MRDRALSPIVRLLGYAGLLPQLIFLGVALAAPPIAPAAAILGWAYAGLIFSFLGGVWWGYALLGEDAAPRWLLPVSVMPSLIALASVIPIVLGIAGTVIPLVSVGSCLLGSSLVDAAVGRAMSLPSGWTRLRRHLSLGLGLITIAIAGVTA